MASLDFPNPPLTVGQQTTATNGVLYQWDGTVWVAKGATGATGPAGPEGPVGPQGPAGISAGKILYYAPSDASDIATYKTLLPSPSAGAEQTIATVCTGTGDVLVAAFATDTGVPGAVDYPAGTAYRRIYASVSAGTARLHLQVYKRDAAGVETLIRDEFSQSFANLTVALQEWIAVAASAGALTATDRIVNKVSAQRVSGPTTITVTTYYEGAAHGSHIQTTISTGAQGPPGPGVPAGGTAAQQLAKTSGADYDTAWVTAPWKSPAAGVVSLTTTTNSIGMGTDSPAVQVHAKAAAATPMILRIEADAGQQASYQALSGTMIGQMLCRSTTGLEWWLNPALPAGGPQNVLACEAAKGDFWFARDDGKQFVAGGNGQNVASPVGNSSTAVFTPATFYGAGEPTTAVVVGRNYRLRASGYLNRVTTSQLQLWVTFSGVIVWRVTLGPDAAWTGGKFLLDVEMRLQNATNVWTAGILQLSTALTTYTTTPITSPDAATALTYVNWANVGSIAAPGSITLSGQFSESNVANLFYLWRRSVAVDA